MPKRTNEFQKLVYMLQKQLSDEGVVTESKMLRDIRSNDEVEVDIVIDVCVTEVEIVISIECTSSTRPATVEWVREMIGKHQDLPTNKLVLVSKSGFTKKGKSKASEHNVDVVLFEEAGAIDWANAIGNLKNLMLGAFNFSVLSGGIIFEKVMPNEPDLILKPDLLVMRESDKAPFKLRDYFEGILRDKRIALKFMNDWIKTPVSEQKKDLEINVTVEPHSNTKIQAEDGSWHKIKKIELKVRVEIETTPVELKTKKFRESIVALGSAKNIFKESEDQKSDLLITFVEKEGEPIKGSIFVPKLKGTDEEIFVAEFTKDENNDTK